MKNDKDLDEFNKVISNEENIEVAEEQRKVIIGMKCTIAAIIIIIGTYLGNSCSNKVVDTKSNNINHEDSNIENQSEAKVASSIEEDVENVVNTNEIIEISFDDKEIDYSTVDTFMNQITEYRNKYGEFAESFKSPEDVKEFIKFVYSFNSLYSVDSKISSQEEFDNIVSDYYNSCVKYGEDANLSLLFPEQNYIQKKLKESEALANDLKNGKGTDYEISKKYYTWMGLALMYGPTEITSMNENNVYIEILIRQYFAYRNVGNMLSTRKNLKNDSLSIPGIEVYYGYKPKNESEIIEINNSFSCPDGIDNFITETEHEGANNFQTVDNSFEYVTKKLRTR